MFSKKKSGAPIDLLNYLIPVTKQFKVKYEYVRKVKYAGSNNP